MTLLTEIPAPYRIPLFNALAERVDLQVLFLAARDPRRSYGLHPDEMRFRHEVLPGAGVTVGGRWVVASRGVSRRLRGTEAVVLGGWNQPAFWEALAWCAVRRVPAIVWVESTAGDRRSGRLEWAKRLMLRRIPAFLVPGSASRDYLRGLGVADGRIGVAPNAVDTAIFSSATRTRANGSCRLIAVGRLVPEKGIDTLLQAAEGLPVEIALAGTGPDEARLRRLAGPNVSFLGQLDRDALPGEYANADVAVLPSRSDPWGMILNEAALAGLPLVATTAAGAAHGLIEDGVNGFVVPPDDPDALRRALRRLVEDEPFRRAAGERSREIAARFTPEAWADSVVAVVDRLVADAPATTARTRRLRGDPPRYAPR